MATKPEHHEAIRAFVKNLKPPLKLSLAALETLAVIAYKQPITAPEIMEIRGVQGAGVLKTLLDRKLITTAGRKNVIGRPILYKTTKDFLVQFGLKDLNELPTLKEFEDLRRLALERAEPLGRAGSAAAAEPARGSQGPNGANRRNRAAEAAEARTGPMAEERLQKILAHAGVASRRKAEELILEGRVTVNGSVVDRPGHQGRSRHATTSRWTASCCARRSRLVYIALNKPDDVRHHPVRSRRAGRTVMDLRAGRPASAFFRWDGWTTTAKACCC